MDVFGILLVLFICTTICYYLKCPHNIKYNKLGLGMLLYVILFCILAFLFYHHPTFEYSLHSGYGTSLSGMLYFYFIYIIWLWPFLNGYATGFKKVIISKELEVFILIVAISSLLESLLLFPKAISGLHSITQDIVGLREESSSSGNIGSGITSIPVLIYSFFGSILPLAFFCYLIDSRNKILVFLLGVWGFLTPALITLSTGTRQQMVFPIIDYFIAYLIFYPYINTKLKKRINISIVSISLLIFVLCVWMSFLRFDGSEFSPDFFIFKYLGEGFVNFNTLLYERVGDPLYGDFNLSYFRDILGIDNYEDYFARRIHVASIVKFDTTLFYTFIGGILVDWGKIGGILFSLLIIIPLTLFTRRKGESIMFSQLFMLHFVACICAKGVFYFHLRSEFGGKMIDRKSVV